MLQRTPLVVQRFAEQQNVARIVFRKQDLKHKLSNLIA
jgi:hypothetical protein